MLAEPHHFYRYSKLTGPSCQYSGLDSTTSKPSISNCSEAGNWSQTSRYSLVKCSSSSNPQPQWHQGGIFRRDLRYNRIENSQPQRTSSFWHGSDGFWSTNNYTKAGNKVGDSGYQSKQNHKCQRHNTSRLLLPPTRLRLINTIRCRSSRLFIPFLPWCPHRPDNSRPLTKLEDYPHGNRPTPPNLPSHLPRCRHPQFSLQRILSIPHHPRPPRIPRTPPPPHRLSHNLCPA